MRCRSCGADWWAAVRSAAARAVVGAAVGAALWYNPLVMQLHGHDIGVCSWSLRPSDTRDLITTVQDCGLSHMQLALGGYLAMDSAERDSALALVRDSGLRITAGMISFPGEDYSTIAAIRKSGGYVPEARWPERKELTIRAGQLARDLGITLLTTHIGFVPPSNDGSYATILGRVAEVAEAMAGSSVRLLFETGQETAAELLQFLNDVPSRNVGVNFDPANMILYGAGDPIDAVRILGRHIQHVHVKDAKLSDQPKLKWGTEVPFGTGQVRPRRFLDALDAVGYSGPLVIEREMGEDRARDVKAAVAAIASA